MLCSLVRVGKRLTSRLLKLSLITLLLLFIMFGLRQYSVDAFPM